jgi:hypothetical protein
MPINFLGALQPVAPAGNGNFRALPRICARGQCEGHEDAKEQLKQLYLQEHPEYGPFIENEHLCHGGVFVFDCSPYELIEKAADDESARLIQEIYEDAIELSPFVEQ